MNVEGSTHRLCCRLGRNWASVRVGLGVGKLSVDELLSAQGHVMNSTSSRGRKGLESEGLESEKRESEKRESERQE